MNGICMKCGGVSLYVSHEEDGDEVKCFSCGQVQNQKTPEPLPVLYKHNEKTKFNLGIKNGGIKPVTDIAVKTAASVPPPKPQFTGKPSGGKARALKEYYDQNKDAIIADFDQLGEKDMLEKWGISESGWLTMRVRFMPDRFTMPDWACRHKPRNKPKEDKPAAVPAMSQVPAPAAVIVPAAAAPVKEPVPPPGQCRECFTRQAAAIPSFPGRLGRGNTA